MTTATAGLLSLDPIAATLLRTDAWMVVWPVAAGVSLVVLASYRIYRDKIPDAPLVAAIALIVSFVGCVFTSVKVHNATENAANLRAILAWTDQSASIDSDGSIRIHAAGDAGETRVLGHIRAYRVSPDGVTIPAAARAAVERQLATEHLSLAAAIR